MYVCMYVCMHVCMYQELLKNYNKFLVAHTWRINLILICNFVITSIIFLKSVLFNVLTSIHVQLKIYI